MVPQLGEFPLTYRIVAICDDALPLGHEWIFVCTATDVVLFLRRSCLGDLRVLEEAWAAFRLMTRGELQTPLAAAV